MKFGLYLEENTVSEWKDFYINYKLLKKLLKIFQARYKSKKKTKTLKKLKNLVQKGTDKNNTSMVSLLEIQDFNMTIEEERKIINQFYSQMLIELRKVNYFFYENTAYYHKRINKITEQLEYIAKNQNLKYLKINLENALKELFKEIMLMKSYIELNLKAKVKIMKKFTKLTKDPEYKENKTLVEKVIASIDDYMKKSNLLNPLQIISTEQTEIEKLFSEHFFDKYSFGAVKVLKDYCSEVFLTHFQSFYFGFFVGLLAVILLLCVIIGIHYSIDMDDDAKFKTIFPMFRGYLVFVFYFWYLGCNVYVWNIAHINYRLAFNFDNHYSTVVLILKRAAFFSFIGALMLLCYMILRTQIPILYDLVSFIPLEITPILCYLVAAVYIFCPFDCFNYLGRKYLGNLFVESMANLTHKIEFRHIWFTDQLTSLIGPLRDLEYTVCYYTHYQNTFEEKKRLCSSRRPIVLLLACYPHFIRFLQCARVCYDEGRVFPSALNCGKYMFSILVAISSYYSSTIQFFSNTWMIIAVTSTLYSSTWDIKCDYGMLQKGPNYPLRNKLSYSKKGIYYTAMTINVFLRSAWVLTISPEVIYRFIRPEFFLMMIYLFEAFRRGMWNFFRVELKHIEICKEFKVCPHIELPLKKVGNIFVIRTVKMVVAEKQNKRMEKLRQNSVLSIQGLGANKKETSTSLVKLGLKPVTSDKNLMALNKEKQNNESILDKKQKFQDYLNIIEEKTKSNFDKVKKIEMKNIKIEKKKD